MNLLFNEAENHNPTEKIFTIIHVCSSHIIKTIIKMRKLCFPNKRTQKNERSVAIWIFTGYIVEIWKKLVRMQKNFSKCMNQNSK